MGDFYEDNDEPHYATIQSVCGSDTGTGSSSKLPEVKIPESKSHRTSPALEKPDYNDVNFQCLSRGIQALNLTHGRYMYFAQDSSFPAIVSGHKDCLCCSHERKWIGWRIELNKQISDNILKGDRYVSDFRETELSVSHTQGCDFISDIGEFRKQTGSESCLPSHHYVMYGIPRARLHCRSRH